MTTDLAEVAGIVDGVREHWTGRRATVRQLAKLLDVPQADLAKGLKMSRQSFNGRMNGATTLQPWELAGIAAMLGVPVSVLDLEPVAATQWVVDHAQALGFPRNRWFSEAA